MIIKNCKLSAVLTEGCDLTEADVRIEDGKIREIAPCGAFAAEENGIRPGGEQPDTEIFDAEGKTLIPGLIDMHVHLFMGFSDRMQMLTLPPAGFAYKCLEYAQALLELGYTTVRDVGDNVAWPTVSLAQEIEKGNLVGPTIIPSGPILCPTARNTSPVLSVPIDGPDDTRRQARLSLKKGAQFIKMYGSASMNSPVGEVGHPIIEPDEIREAVKAAEAYGTYVAIHCHGSRAIDNAVKSGVHTVEHASLISEETLRYMEKNDLDCGIVPTLFVITNMIATENDNPAAKRAAAILDQIFESLKNAYRHGVLIGWGTDVRMPQYLAHPETEFRLRKEKLHYADEDIIRQATINSAKLMRMEDRIGSVKVGKDADLLLVEGDPARDITVMYQKPAHVFKKGVRIH